MLDFAFLRERKKVLLVLAGVIVFLLTLIGSRLFLQYLAGRDSVGRENYSNNLINLPIIENEVLPQVAISPLTGLELIQKTEIKPIAVVIENLPASRPQMRGLNEAGIVIEALAEGGITRFLAVFDTSELKKVGPVRSARPYFVDWAEEFGGALVHAGGSDDALAEIAKTKLVNFDEKEDSDVLFRDFQYLKPHNLFVNLAEARKSITKNNLPEIWFDFSGEIPRDAATVKKFSLDFSLPSYFVEYNYDSTDGKYDRKLGGEIHSAGNIPIRPTNVIIQFTEYFPIDDAGRLQLRTTGEGVAWYFSEGKFWRGVWKKIGGRTQFFDNFSKPVSLNPGQTFIEVLDAKERVSLPTK
ncbi:MAG: DUF3048 domain-containing protein [Patescibacteria group bacterium]